jgi:hypothetical protein
MSNPPDYAGVFRYSDQYPDAVERWWEPEDDLEDVAAELRELIDDELRVTPTSTPAAEFEAHQYIECPDYQVRAAVFMLPSPPWATQENQRWAWVLFWEDDSELNVVEHLNREAAVVAFFRHVAFCEIDGRRYDYVVNPRDPRTAMPPGWKPLR